MMDILVDAVEKTQLDKEGGVIIRLQSREHGLVAITFPAEFAAALAATFAQAKIQSSRNPEETPYQTRHAQSVRVLFHKPSGRPTIRFDEGTDFESNFSLHPDQMQSFAQQVQDCLAFIKRRQEN
jgi:hypothetical protein